MGIDLGTTTGVCRLFLDGGIEVESVNHPKNIQGRCCGLADIIRRHGTPDCIGVCFEEPFSGQFSSVKALFPMMGAGVLVCEELGLPWSLINLTKLKVHATGKGNAKKPDVVAAARARWGREFSEDGADASWAAAYALDTLLFGTGIGLTQARL